jgi:hypothetical protein
MAASGVGTILGAFFTTATGRRRSVIWLVSVTLSALGAAGLGLTERFAVASALLSIIGLATLSFIGSSNILLQTLAPNEIRGRVISVYSMILLGFVPLGALLVGSVAAVLELRWTLVAAGALATLCALAIALTQPKVRAA